MSSILQDAAQNEHLWILGFVLIAIMGSFILEPAPGEGIYIPVPGADLKVRAPESCFFHRTLGIPCPGCGLTRSFVATARGDFRRAVEFNPMGPVLYLVCLLQIPYRLSVYFDWPWTRRIRHVAAPYFPAILWLLVSGFIICWVVRLAYLLI